MEPQHGNGNDKQSEPNPEGKPKEDENEEAKEVRNLGVNLHKNIGGGGGGGSGASISRSSSSSSSSSDHEKDVPQWSMVSASPRGGSGILTSSADVFNRTPDWVMCNSSPMKSPTLQAMGRGYDPNRIPSSVFASKPGTPMDWSVASNESLFSIHMGNNSFSRENAFLMGEEWNDSLNNFTPNLPTVAETPRQSVSRTNVFVRPGLEEEPDETPKIGRGESGDVHGNEAHGARPSSASNLPEAKGLPRAESHGARASNDSMKSSDSFAFPVLLADGTKGDSLKVATEKSPKTSEPQTPGEDDKPQAAETQAAAAAPSGGWLSCLSCWPTKCC